MKKRALGVAKVVRAAMEVLEGRMLLAGDFGLAFKVGGANSGSFTDAVHAVATDTSGNVYVAGTFSDTGTFTGTSSTAVMASAGGQDIFVVKYSSAGQTLWAKSVGGTGEDVAYDLAVDSTGNVYVTGSFTGTVDFNPGTSYVPQTSQNGTDAFVLKLFSNGDFGWVYTDDPNPLWTGSTVAGRGIAVDSGMRVTVRGTFEGVVDFDPTGAAANLTSDGDDTFVWQISQATGSPAHRWATMLPSAAAAGEGSRGIAADSTGNVYVTGQYSGTGPGGVSSAGGQDAFLVKLSDAGAVTWARSFGGTGTDRGVDVAVDVAVDGSGHVTATGLFSGTGTFGGGTLVSAGGEDAFVVRLDSGGAVTWRYRTGGAGNDAGHGVAAGVNGAAFVAAQSGGLGVVQKIGSNGSLDYSRDFGASLPTAVAWDGMGRMHVAGRFSGSVDFDPSGGVATLTAAGSDGFVAQLTDYTPAAVVTPTSGLTTSESGDTATFTVVLTAQPAADVTIPLGSSNTAEGTVAGSTLTFTPENWNEPQTVTVTGVDDSVADGSQTYTIMLGTISSDDPNYNGVEPADVTVVNTDNEPPVMVTVSRPDIHEGLTNNTATLTFSMVAASETLTIVDFSFAGSTVYGKDYTVSGATWNGTNRTLTIPPGALSAEITFTAVDDALYEKQEIMTLTARTGAGAGDAILSLYDNGETPPTVTLSLTGSPILENGGKATVTATLSEPSGMPVKVMLDYRSSTATVGLDYLNEGFIIIPVESTSGSITLTALADEEEDNDETIVVIMPKNGAPNASVPEAQQVTAVISNVVTPRISIGSATVTEGDDGEKEISFPVALSLSPSHTVTVQYETRDGTALAGTDYVATTGTLTFAPGEQVKMVVVKVKGDMIAEANETFTVKLSNPTTALLSVSEAAGTIVNDEVPGAVQFSAGTYTVSEKAGVATVTVTRSGGSAGGASVRYSARMGTATPGSDFAETTGVLTFEAGEMSKTFAVAIVNDALKEAGETVLLTLSDAVYGMALGTPAAATLIIANDDKPKLYAGLKATTRLSGSTTPHSFTVTYVDSRAINAASIGKGDIQVVGPNGYSTLATFVSKKPGTNARSIAAVYRIPARGGRWDASDNGVYKLVLRPKAVSNTAGSFVASGTLGHFLVNVAAAAPVAMAAAPASVFGTKTIRGDGGVLSSES